MHYPESPKVSMRGGVNNYSQRDQQMDNTFKRDGKPERLRTPVLEDLYLDSHLDFRVKIFSFHKIFAVWPHCC